MVPGAEFGRTIRINDNDGRDHHNAFVGLLAGAGDHTLARGDGRVGHGLGVVVSAERRDRAQQLQLRDLAAWV
jgi:uncharacterized protein (DUF1501 family)